ncbi:MAG: hypothetical protein QOF73_2961 [Thermomicrobiales bacterium]|nr:hypothetical protein [Thermomicrobiales bacterium]
MIRSRFLLLAAIVTLALADLVVLVPPVQAAGSVAVTAWSCSPGIDPKSNDPAAFAAACTTEADGLMFALTAGGFTRRRATAPDRPASWAAVTGAFTLVLDAPKGEPAVAFCLRNGGAPERFEAPAGEIKGDLAPDTALTCQWYRLPAVSTPAPTATAQPTTVPTSTPAPTVAPTAPVSPTATQFPTATPFPTQGATATPAVTPTPAVSPTPTTPPLPEPIDTGPPKMFRGDPAHTGRQGDSGPAGDPVLLWRYPIGDRPNSSPAVAAGTVYVGSDAGLFAVDAVTGTERWRMATELPITSSPAVAGGVVYVGGEDGNFYGVDAGTGVERWRFETGGKIRSSPVVADGAVVFSSFDGNIYALDAETGEERWRFARAGDDMVSSPAIVDGTVFIGIGDLDGGLLLALSAEDGTEQWRYRVTGYVQTSPTILGGIVYFGGDDGFLYAVEIESRRLQCRFETGKLMRSSPAALDGVIVIGDRLNNLYALNAGTCEELWRFEAEDWMDSSAAVAGSTLYVGSKDDNLYALDPGTGAERWRFPVGQSVLTSPVVAGGVVYFASRDGFLYAVTGSENEGNVAPPPDDAARPADVPAELVLDDGRYRFDRLVTLDRDTLELTDEISFLQLFARQDRQENGPIYTNRPIDDEEKSKLVRYLPERIGAAQLACPADGATSGGQLQAGDATYAFAGLEPDLTVDDLTQRGEAPGLGAVYAEADQSPITELFIASSDGLQRFVLLDGDGLPAALRSPFPFASQTYAFAEDATDQVEDNTLGGVGCAGPFAMKAAPDAAKSPFSRLYATIAGRLLAFDPVDSSGEQSASTNGPRAQLFTMERNLAQSAALPFAGFGAVAASNKANHAR